MLAPAMATTLIALTGVAAAWLVLAFFALGVSQAVPVRPTRAILGTFAREWAALCLSMCLMPFGVFSRSPTPYGPRSDEAWTDAARVPVLLIPGYAMNRSCMWMLSAYLRRRGWRWVWPVNNRPLLGGLDRIAEQLGEQVDRLRAASGSEQVDLVAHSAGGLVAALYLCRFGGAGKVRRLITLGTPWLGTGLGSFGIGRAGRDCLPGTPTITSIHAPAAAVVSVWSRSDHMVIPSANACPDFAECVEVPALGHVEMLSSAQVFRLVRDHLARPDRAEAA